MSKVLDDARVATQQLSSDEKLLLGVELIDAAREKEGESESGAEEAWDAEILRRVEEIRSGKATLVEWETAVSQTNKRFGWDK